MARPNRITLLAFVLGVFGAAACGSNKKDVEHARHSVYDADFAIVYQTALDVTREHYPSLNDNPGPGKIATAWHQVSYANNQDDLSNQQILAQGQGVMSTSPTSSGGVGTATPAQSMSGMPTRLAYKRYFVRFDVAVIGGRPWKVKVTGHASEWDPGAAMPVEMRGAQRPAWLDGRIESLQVAIYKRLRKVAVPMKEAEPVNVVEDEHTDPGKFANVPPAAAQRLAALKDVLAKRDYTALRPLLDDNIVWSLGGGTGADVAIATWEADPTILESMNASIDAGCAVGPDKKLACPAGAEQRGVYQLVLEQRGPSWLVTSFVKAE
jgi:hypothetical protein